MNQTENYSLNKPEYTDNVDVAKLNENADIIDAKLKEHSDALELKVDKVSGKGLSTNDFTTAEKIKLDDLAEIKSIGTGLNLDSSTGELTATGGGGGTSDYTDLINKPQINSVLLSGNKSLSDLGITYESKTAASGGTALSLVTTGEKYAWNNKQSAIDDLSTIRSGAALGATAVQPVTGKGLSTNDYTTAEKTKLAGIAEGAEVNEIEGIKVNSSTVNPDVNKVVNITVPTTAADVSALPDTTKYATALSLTINSSTFVMTGQLKDQNGDNLGTAQTIDLPLESFVVNGSYNNTTKKVVLTLQNGNIIEFSVADLVAGLQTELSASNKLNPAYINYDSTHRAVSDTEKSTWNGKQSALSTAQLAAVNSGIDSAKVEQIETNKNNILTINAELIDLVDSGAKNELYFTLSDLQTWNSATATGATWSENVCTTNGISFTVNSDGTITANGTLTSERAIFRIMWNTPNVYGGKILSGCPSGGSPSTYEMNLEQVASPWATIAQDRGNGSKITNNTSINIYGYIAVKTSVSNLTFRPMICSKAAWEVSQKYVPYAMTNAEITAWIQAHT